MFKQITILAVVGLASAASVPTQYPTASVYNNCKWDVFVTDGKTQHDLPAGQVYSNGLPKGGDKHSYKIARATSGTDVPTLVFSFDSKNGKVSYDLSEVHGSPFSGFKVQASANDDKCPKIEWEHGVPAGRNHATCAADVSVAVGLCL
ncbi:hypothetical protein LMH87_006861 [Akanthomyces muscarius]|uniref:Blastomyces-phase-specific protein n=2 Tax=Akanthomyces TaxID=150366 RepID=A0A168JVZ8_CORDF|nr:hypothetical protein LMH87_006861 [Akanthomyces muscarius]KAJ4165220.1 hypothetical protein LMH87_006861 [Akanthomyces muscarius]OAA80939.1 Blastomyces -phase-specific protein [Akanthomyces lecanii RCEF 1005]